jgi:hypothetical protein
MGVVFSCKVTTTKTNITLVKKRGVTWVVISLQGNCNENHNDEDGVFACKARKWGVRFGGALQSPHCIVVAPRECTSS